MPKAYYNEINPFVAAWLRELMNDDLIAPGDVDERSIEDVTAADLVGYTQCHFFAGLGGWPYALRLAGWPDSRPVWTGSCPCPPFSVAGKKKSCPECGSGKPLPHAFRTGIFRCTACGYDWYADGRHLWPEFYRLIAKCRPVRVYGEQVAGRDGQAWGDIVQATLELENYAVGRVHFASCGVGAPHIRMRLYWVAHGLANTEHHRRKGRNQKRERTSSALSSGKKGWLDNSISNGCGARRDHNREYGRQQPDAALYAGRLVNPFRQGLEAVTPQGQGERRTTGWTSASCELDNQGGPGPTNGLWKDVDWLFCRDGKLRPTQSLSQSLADGLAHRLGYSRFADLFSLNPLKESEKEDLRKGRLEAYGNAINPVQAAEFIIATEKYFKEQNA